jgi:hypothetical protein
MATSINTTSTNTEMAYIIIVHFRQLKGNQSFALDHDSAVDFAQRVNKNRKKEEKKKSL